MRDGQFDKSMDKLEDIRCCIIDNDPNTKPNDSLNNITDQLRIAFYHQLETKTGWGRNEIKAIFESSIEDRSDMFWKIDSGKIKYAETVERFNSDGDYYVDIIYTQRFYEKHVYRGSELTMIFVDTHTDGNKFFAFYSNDKEIT